MLGQRVFSFCYLLFGSAAIGVTFNSLGLFTGILFIGLFFIDLLCSQIEEILTAKKEIVDALNRQH